MRTFKLLRWVQLFNRLVHLGEILYGGSDIEYCLLLSLCRESRHISSSQNYLILSYCPKLRATLPNTLISHWFQTVFNVKIDIFLSLVMSSFIHVFRFCHSSVEVCMDPWISYLLPALLVRLVTARGGRRRTTSSCFISFFDNHFKKSSLHTTCHCSQLSMNTVYSRFYRHQR
jgi:hypothetical protein